MGVVFAGGLSGGSRGRSAPWKGPSGPGASSDRRRELADGLLVLLRQRLLAIQAERLDRRSIAGREQDRVLGRTGGMLGPAPGRHTERVAALPVEALAVEHARAAAFDHVVDGIGGRP